MYQSLNSQKLNHEYIFPRNKKFLNEKTFNNYTPNPYYRNTNFDNFSYLNDSIYNTNSPQHNDNKIIKRIPLRHNSTNYYHYNQSLSSRSFSKLNNNSEHAYNNYFNKTYYPSINKNKLYNDNTINSNIYDYSNDIKTYNTTLNENKNHYNYNYNYNQKNHFDALAFDDYMSKLAINKFNKINEFNNSYYSKKHLCGDDYDYYNKDNDELKSLDKNMEEKYDLYKINGDKKCKSYNTELNYIKKPKYRNKFNKSYKHNKTQDMYLKYSINSSDSDSSYGKHDETIKSYKYKSNENKIQKTLNINIGKDNNNSHIFSIYKHYKKDDLFLDKNNNNKNNNKENINTNNDIDNNNNLLLYLKKENEELKQLNLSYKQLLDTLFYFLNNISHKYSKLNNDENDEKLNCTELFDLTKYINNNDDFKKKLFMLENVINENIEKLKIFNNKNKYNLLSIIKENSFNLPEWNRLIQFNNLIENINEKCFSFKNINKDNDIENNEVKNNNKINNDKKNNKEKNGNITNLLGCNIEKRRFSSNKNKINKNG